MHPKFRIAAAVLGLGLGIGVTVSAHAAGNVEAGKTKSAMCMACHGADGNGGADPLWPKLAGQDAAYLVKQLKDFKSGARKDPIMAGMAAGLTPQDMENLAAFYAAQKTKRGAAKNAELAKAGERLYRGGNAKTGITACMGCHGPAGTGIPPRFPQIAAQNVAYTTKQLNAFKSGARANDGETMTRIVARMTDQEIKAVAEYMAGLH